MADAIDEEIKFKIGAEGSEQVARLLSELNRTLGGTSAALDNASASAARVNTALPRVGAEAAKSAASLTNLQRTTQKSAVVIGQLTSAVSTVSPELATLTGGVGRAGAAFSALSSVAGGPLLIGITVAVGAFTALAKWMKETEDRAKDLATALEKDVAERAARAVENIAKARALIDVVLSPDSPEVRANIEKQKELIASSRSLSGQERVSANRALGVLRDQEAELRAKAENDAALKEIETREKGAFGDAGGASRAGGRRQDEASAVLEREAARQRQLANLDRQLAGGGADAGPAIEAAVSARKMQVDEETSLQRAHHDAIIEDAKRKDAELAALDEQAAARQQINRDTAMAGFQAVGSTGIKALQMLAKGQKVTAKAIVAGIGDALVASGERTIMEGIALSLNPLTPGLGGPMAAHGAAMVAAGLVMGAATSRSGAGGGGGGGGRGGNMTRGPASPSLSPGTTNASGGGTRVYQVTMSSVVAPGPEDGQRVRRALQEADRAGL